MRRTSSSSNASVEHPNFAAAANVEIGMGASVSARTHRSRVGGVTYSSSGGGASRGGGGLDERGGSSGGGADSASGSLPFMSRRERKRTLRGEEYWTSEVTAAVRSESASKQQRSEWRGTAVRWGITDFPSSSVSTPTSDEALVEEEAAALAVLSALASGGGSAAPAAARNLLYDAAGAIHEGAGAGVGAGAGTVVVAGAGAGVGGYSHADINGDAASNARLGVSAIMGAAAAADDVTSRTSGDRSSSASDDCDAPDEDTMPYEKAAPGTEILPSSSDVPRALYRGRLINF